MATASRVRIVHGFGMGILRKTIQGYSPPIPTSPNSTPPPQEGGAGATIVELRE